MPRQIKQNWKISQDKASINSISKVFIPWLSFSLAIWFETEENQNWYTDNQSKTFEEFLNMPTNSLRELIAELDFVYSTKFKKEKVEYEAVLDSINWEESQVCIPQLYNSENNYFLLLLETKWKIIDSDFTVELEILYTNGKIEICQEMSGIWNRIEWFDDYLKRKIIYNKV